MALTNLKAIMKEPMVGEDNGAAPKFGLLKKKPFAKSAAPVSPAPSLLKRLTGK